MSNQNYSKEILKKIFDQIAENADANNEKINSENKEADEKDVSLSSVIGESEFLLSSNNDKIEQNIDEPEETLFESIELADVEKQQKIVHRDQLLHILSRLFTIQLVFMNIIVLCVVVWTVFRCKCFNTVESNVLDIVTSFMKYYISAILAELLTAIIYITHKVFSKK